MAHLRLISVNAVPAAGVSGVARINVEDNIESREEFWGLLRALDGDRDRALGMLIRFWRIAQKYWGHGELVPTEEMAAHGLQPIIDARWALPQEGRFYAIGSEEQFAWYRQKVEAGKSGGRPRKPERAPANRDTAPANRGTLSVNPPAPSPAPSPAPIQKQEYIYGGASEKAAAPLTADGVRQACEEWKASLRRWGSACDELTLREQEAIARGIQRFTLEAVLLAIRGVRHQTKTDAYDPAKHLRLGNVFDPDKIDRLINLGRQAAEREERGKSPARAKVDLPCHFCGHPNDDCRCGADDAGAA